MKSAIKIISVIILAGMVLFGVLIIGENYGAFSVDLFDVLSSITLIIIALLVIFLTATILISPQTIIKSSPEIWVLREKDKILQTKLSVLKKEKELLEIQKDIDNLKSASGSL